MLLHRLHLLEQFKAAILVAMRMDPAARLAAGDEGLQSGFPYSRWSQALEDQYGASADRLVEYGISNAQVARAIEAWMVRANLQVYVFAR